MHSYGDVENEEIACFDVSEVSLKLLRRLVDARDLSGSTILGNLYGDCQQPAVDIRRRESQTPGMLEHVSGARDRGIRALFWQTFSKFEDWTSHSKCLLGLRGLGIEASTEGLLQGTMKRYPGMKCIGPTGLMDYVQQLEADTFNQFLEAVEPSTTQEDG